MLTVGNKAPEFSLYNSDKTLVSLTDYKGKNLTILFFPLAFTSVCTAELCSVRDDIAFYQGIGSDVVAISVDSPQTLAKFKQDQQLNFPLLSDFNKEASTAYDCLYEVFSVGLKGVSKRSAFVVDKDGILRYVEVLEKASDMPNLEAVKKIVEGLR